MPSDLSAYLATRYLTADPKPSKKRKRKQAGAAADAGLLITDDADTGWTRSGGGEDDDEDGIEASVAGTSAEFRKAKKSGWKVVGGASASSDPSAAATTQQQNPRDQARESADASAREADAILATAAADASAAGGAEGDDDVPVMMSDGTHAGLQSAAAVSAQLERRRKAERAEFEKTSKFHKEAETVYRDATGRRVDVEWKRAEARRAAAAAREREEEAQRALRGDAQAREAERRREELLDARTMAFARTADDEGLNEELRAQTRWGDTMAQFVGSGGGGGAGGSKKRRGLKGRPVYQGAAPPNRYGIRPGYRWDGVDRGNGFEAERFKAINRRERNKGLEYSWQMDE
ncbi:hypothetical protein DL766_007029 [Monosporascus sp. MC13-8B]|uniref:Pre-mRNA-splicing factor CWC26 n=1 Tax=Monosporascus cannonballus TaxID=155416 RepID=A0ABY0H3S9_9PEZI|nr:hypothetical protein DL763_008030 [Monosporascus cannonballus]RYO84088.1 hypothetical protein DL762_005834 [Monosporascus cannonballus]RYP25479.1 hypothetical protein DL766_007029 [Monosporascus sp. MC13-8B]